MNLVFYQHLYYKHCKKPFINPKRVVAALKSLYKSLLVALIVKFGLTSSHKYRKYNLCFQRKLDFFLCLLIVSIRVGEEKALFFQFPFQYCILQRTFSYLPFPLYKEQKQYGVDIVCNYKVPRS